jgi:spore maturation protein SpmA
MTTAKDLTDQLINRAKNLQEFVVERDFDYIPTGVVKFNIQHTVGQPARIFVPALTQTEAEDMVDEWFSEDVE